MVVCICFLYEPEAQTLIEAKCTVILKSEGQTHSLSLPVRPFYYVSQHGGTNASILMTQLNLNLADFYDVGTLEYLDHANPNSVHFYERDVPAFPALGKLPHVPSFVPAAPCGAKQLLVNVAAQLIEPSFIGRQCSLQANPHAFNPRDAIAVTPNDSAAHLRAAHPILSFVTAGSPAARQVQRPVQEGEQAAVARRQADRARCGAKSRESVRGESRVLAAQ